MSTNSYLALVRQDRKRVVEMLNNNNENLREARERLEQAETFISAERDHYVERAARRHLLAQQINDALTERKSKISGDMFPGLKRINVFAWTSGGTDGLTIEAVPETVVPDIVDFRIKGDQGCDIRRFMDSGYLKLWSEEPGMPKPRTGEIITVEARPTWCHVGNVQLYRVTGEWVSAGRWAVTYESDGLAVTKLD